MPAPTSRRERGNIVLNMRAASTCGCSVEGAPVAAGLHELGSISIPLPNQLPEDLSAGP